MTTAATVTSHRVQRDGDRSLRFVRLAAVAMLLLTTGLPFAALLLQSVAGAWRWPALLPATYTLDAWRDAARGDLVSAAVTSLALAVLTALTATALALPAARAAAAAPPARRVLAAALLFLPVAVPPIALGVGLQVVLLRLGLGGTFAGVWIAHLVPATGYLALILLGVFVVRGRDDEEAARTHGASAWRTWWHVLLPSLSVPLAEALAIGFLISWTQVPLTLLVGGGAVRALPIEVFALIRAGEAPRAAVGAVLLVVPAMIVVSAVRDAARRTGAPLA